MQLQLEEEQKAVVAAVRRFVQHEIVPLEMELDPDASEFPAEDYARLVLMTKAMGLFNLDLPEEFGGPGLTTVMRCLIAIELSQHPPVSTVPPIKHLVTPARFRSWPRFRLRTNGSATCFPQCVESFAPALA